MRQDDDLQSEYFTVASFDPRLNWEDHEYTSTLAQMEAMRISDKNYQQCQNTLSTTKVSVIHKNNQADSDSCFGQFADIVQGLPLNLGIKKIESSGGNKKNCNLNEIDRNSAFAKSNWINENELKCFIDYQGKIAQTFCKIKDGQLVIVNGGCRFKIQNITKIKALYENYQRCLWFTYQDISKNSITSQKKFKISIENDSRDDLYLLLSKIVVIKLSILEYVIDFGQVDKEEVDRYMMAGELLKKSQFFGRWDSRRMVITDRIESFKGEVCTFQITAVREVWTRFEVCKNFLVLKVRHGMLKTELALPIVNFNAKFCKDNWLYRIYQLVSPVSI